MPDGPRSADGPPAPPALLRVVRGEASAEELAALLTVLALRAAPTPAEPPPASTWAGRRRALRDGSPWPVSERDGWRTSFWPR